MGSKGVENILNLADTYFLNDVTDIVKCFAKQKKEDCVVVFPTYSNYRRYLIHRACEPYREFGLTTFSIGEGDQRRTVLCYANKVKSEFVGSSSTAEAMGVDKRKNSDGAVGGIYRPPPLRRFAACGTNHQTAAADSSTLPQSTVSPSRESIRKDPEKDKDTTPTTKTKRPDREVYVPRQRRVISSTSSGREDCPLSQTSPSGLPQSRSKQKASDRSYCNVYTPPHARGSRSNNTSVVNQNCSDDWTRSVPSDSVVKRSANRKRQHIEDGADSVVDPPANIEHIDNAAHDTEEHVIDFNETETNNHVNMTCNRINNDHDLSWNSKDEDRDQTELERATQEINRSNRRLIKQTFVSDVLIISDPIGSTCENAETECQDIVNLPPLQLETIVDDTNDYNVQDEQRKKEVFNAEEEEWEAMLGEDGECLEPSMLVELNNAVGRVTIQTPRTAPFKPGPDRDPFSHVVEVYNFPKEFTTNDLLSVFSDFKDKGFEIKWVDDNHALAVFSSAKIAEDVLAYNHPMVKTRPLHEATQESRLKARKCAEYLQPYRARPETCPALARRLVSGALGVRLPNMSQERIEEKKQLSQFKEKKRLETQQREKLRQAAWDGSLGSGNDTS